LNTETPGTIDLNADLGEHDGEGHAADEALLDLVSSANIACGAHAGNERVMVQTVRSADQRGVTIGAHPSYPDREGFGRRTMEIGLDELRASVREQIVALRRCCEDAGARLGYVKPHGALYNRAARDPRLARMLAECIGDVDAGLVVLSLPRSELEVAARAAGLGTAREAFIDRAYDADGMLVPRDRDGAVLHGPRQLAIRALRIASEGTVETIDGDEIEITAESLCVHGDNDEAREIVLATRQVLLANGYSVDSFVASRK
jgi:UPF0271 protein